MAFRPIRKKLYNAFAFRFNKLNRALDLAFAVTLNGKDFTVPIIDTLGLGNINLREDWLFKLIRLLELPADVHFLDVGANVGQSLLTFRSCYENTYWGFEPNPACVFYLDTIVRRNKLRNINVVPTGLSSKNSLVKLYARSMHDSGATILQELKPGLFLPQDAKYVPVFSFESLQLNIPKIGLVKIDVEGAELNVIAGMLPSIKAHQPVIICEVLDYTAPESQAREQQRASQLVACLKELKYRMFRIVHKDKVKLEFEPLDDLVLRKWVPESFYLNDYIFLPEHITGLPV